MKFFVTGGSGYIGSHVVKDLLANGHEVEGLSRSEKNDLQLRALGAEALRGDLSSHDVLRRAVQRSDAIVHLAFGAFSQDMSENFERGRVEADAISVMGDEVAGVGKPLVTTSGCGLIAEGVVVTEDMVRRPDEGLFRSSEQMTPNVVARGAKAMVVRIPQVNGPNNEGFVPLLIQLAKANGYAAYIGEGLNRWPAAHVEDAAAVYRLAAEKGQAGQIFHAVAEEGVALRDIASVIAEKLDLPLRSIAPGEAELYFGQFTMFAAMDNPVSSLVTRNELGWEPTGPTMLEDIRNGDYFST